MLGILHIEFTVLLQQVNVPDLAVVKGNLEALALLLEGTEVTVFGQGFVKTEGCGNRELIVKVLSQKLTVTTEFVQDTLVLVIQHPTVGACLKQIIFQRQNHFHIPVHIDAAGQLLIARLFQQDGVQTLLQISKGKVAVFIQLKRLFTGGTLVAGSDVLQIVAAHLVGNNGTGQGFVAFGDGFSLGRDFRAACCNTLTQSHGAVCVEACFLNVLLAIDQDGLQGITCIGSDRDIHLHAGDGRVRTLHGIMLTGFELHRNSTLYTLTVKAEILINIVPGCAILLRKEVPVAVHIHIGASVVKGSDVSGIYIDIAFLHSSCVQVKLVHIFPGNKQLQTVAVAILGVQFAALGGGTQNSHHILGGALLEGHVTGGQQINFKNAVALHIVDSAGRQIHLHAAVQIGCTVQIDVNGVALCHIIDEVHTLFAEIAGHGDLNICAAFLVGQNQPDTHAV